ncbi:MAG TPA: NHL repeat-containing protein [Gemmatimonadales bacterium]|nr:NHL repeat-containing protein [Gemmatimonadales bacterium]
MNARLDLALAATLLGLLAPACTDQSAVAPSAVAPPTSSPGGFSAFVTCEVTVSTATLSCGQATAAPTSGPEAGKSGIDRSAVTLGGQGTYVQLTSSGTAYDGSSVFTSIVTVRNLTTQSMNTTNGTTADTGGVKVFFNSGPSVTGGTGTVTVENPDGTGMFTGTAQPFFKYSSGVVLASGGTTAAKTWQFTVPNTVTSFVFTVYVTTQIPGTQVSPLLLYVLNRGTVVSSIQVYGAGANGTVAPLGTIAGTNTGLLGPYGIVVDGAGNIYVANAGFTGTNGLDITIYSAGVYGNVAPAAAIPVSEGPVGMALDGAGNLYVTTGEPGIEVHGSGSGYTLTATITGAATGLYEEPGGIAVGGGNIYATNQATFFNSGVTSEGPSVTVYATAGLSGTVNLAPTDTIVGDNTDLVLPEGIAVDAAGNIYVANFEGNTITVYAAGANGNATPMAVIAGDSTGLSAPWGIVLDGAGHIYVSNSDNNTITVYPAGANGDVVPTATIQGTGLSNPLYIAF